MSASPTQGDKTGADQQQAVRPAGTIARSACFACRLRKHRCDYDRPTCSACTRKGTNCQYDTRDAFETRYEAKGRVMGTLRQENALLKQQNDESTQQIAELNLQLRERLLGLQLRRDARSDSPYRQSWMADLTAPEIHVETSIESRTSSIASVGEEPDITSPHYGPQDWEALADLVDALITRSDSECQAIVTRLRIGHPWDVVAAELPYIARLSMDREGLAMAERISQGVQDVAGEMLPFTTAVQHSLLDETTLRSPAIGGASMTSLDRTTVAAQKDWLLFTFDRRHWFGESQGYQPFRRVSSTREAAYNVVVDAAGLHRHFSNMDLESPINASSRSAASQDTPRRRLHLPAWPFLTSNNPSHTHETRQPASLLDPFEDPFDKMFREASHDFAAECDPIAFLGHHPYFDALEHADHYRWAPPLSQITASMAYSVMPDETSPLLTQKALMWLWWHLLRWLLFPSERTYDAVPPIMRPTPWQIFAPHPRVFDFVVFPPLREYICRTRIVDARWFSEVCLTVSCARPAVLKNMFAPDPTTGRMTFSTEGQAFVGSIDNWSIGPSVRPYLLDIDRFANVRAPRRSSQLPVNPWP